MDKSHLDSRRAWAALMLLALEAGFGGGCGKRGSTAPPAAAPSPAPPRAPAAPFEHPPLPAGPARARPDCAPEALLAVAHHVADMQTIANLPFAGGPKGSPPAKMKPKKPRPGAPPTDACLTPDGALMAAEAKGPLVDRVQSCMSQDGPFDPEWDMVNSALISLAVCFDCTRPAGERQARCTWVADVLARAQKAVHERVGR